MYVLQDVNQSTNPNICQYRFYQTSNALNKRRVRFQELNYAPLSKMKQQYAVYGLFN